MITLYAADTANSGKIFLALEELELPYEAIPVDLLAGGQFEPAFVSLNPNAKVPVILDPHGPGGRRHVAFESGAILLYLAEKSGRLLPSDPAERSEAIQWLMVQMSSLGPMMGQFIHFSRFAGPGNDYALARYRTQVVRVAEVVEARLGASEWIGGREYSVVDIANFPWLRALDQILDPAPHLPNVKAWLERVAARPAVKRADAAKAELAARLTAPEDAAPDAMDRLLGRGVYARA